MGRKAIVSPGIGERIASLYIAEGRAAFAKELGFSDAQVGHYVRGNAEPSIRFLQILKEKRGVDLDWLLTGEERDHGGGINAFPTNVIGEARDLLKEIVEAADPKLIGYDPEDFSSTFEDLLRMRLEEKVQEASSTNVIEFAARRMARR